MVFQNVWAAMVQNRVATAAATVEAVALLEGGPLKKPDLGIVSSSRERQQDRGTQTFCARWDHHDCSTNPRKLLRDDQKQTNPLLPQVFSPLCMI
jgi:hypothetical protein